MKRNLRMKCPNCGHWNRVPVNKIFIEQPSSEPKVRVLIPMYEPLEVVKCKKYGKVIAEPKELITIQHNRFGEQLCQRKKRKRRNILKNWRKSGAIALSIK